MKLQLASILVPLIAIASLGPIQENQDPGCEALDVETSQQWRLCGTAANRSVLGVTQENGDVVKGPGIQFHPEEDDASRSFQTMLERIANQAAFDQVYTTKKESLMERHAGDWIAIVGGKLLPMDEDGRIAPMPSLEQLSLAIEVASAEAHHRFVFRIGEEGEIRYRPTVNDNPEWIGSQLLGQVQGDLWIAPNGVFVVPKAEPQRGGKNPYGPGDTVPPVSPGGPVQGEPKNVAVTPKGTPFAGGTNIGPGISEGTGPKARLFLHSPDGASKTPVDATVSTGFQGYAVCGNQAAAAIGLGMWEIPGSLDMQFPELLRRARVRVTTRDGEFLDTMVPIGIWADR